MSLKEWVGCPKKRLTFLSHEILWLQLDVSENSGFPPKSSILIGFSIINHPFWGTPIFGNTQLVVEATHLKNMNQIGPSPYKGS